MNLKLVWWYFKFLSPFRICPPLSLFSLPEAAPCPVSRPRGCCPGEELGGCDDATTSYQCFFARCGLQAQRGMLFPCVDFREPLGGVHKLSPPLRLQTLEQCSHGAEVPAPEPEPPVGLPRWPAL